MPSKTFNLSLRALAYLGSLNEANQSAALEKVILAHEYIAPKLQKQQALAELRGSASKLKEMGFEPEAILAWVREIVE